MERLPVYATIRRAWIVAAAAALAALTVVSSPVAAQAAGTPPQRTAAPDTYGCDGYNYVGDVTNNAANEGVYGDIRSGTITYGGTSASHMDTWLGSDVAAPSTSSGLDWLQGGYTIGSQDGLTATGETMYAELEDKNYPDADEFLYPQYGLGNQAFESSMTSTTISGNYGLYYMFDNATLIGEAYLLNPTDTIQQVVLESYSASLEAACPTAADARFGTTGTDGSYDSASEIYIIRHGYISDPWETEISTDPVEDSPYSATWWQDYYAFKASGS